MHDLLRRVKAWLFSPAAAPEPEPSTSDTAKDIGQADHETGQSLVPYDENLLERSRTQWQFGDWASLAAISRDTLQHHPDRAKLALLCAAGHQAEGSATEARQYTRLAIDWGCSKKLISQILISGVHNTLGRVAAAAGQDQRALTHFKAAIQTGDAGGDVMLLTQARLAHQLRPLGLKDRQDSGGSDSTSQITASTPSYLATIHQSVKELGDSLNHQKDQVDAALKKQTDELIRVRKFLDASLKKEVANATKQIEAAVGLQSYFATGELPNINTERHSWPVSPDFALYLVELIETNNYDLIIEFGSGISTVIMAKTLAKMADRRESKTATALVSFDHLEQYYLQTIAQLKQAELHDKVQLELAPLQAYTASNGNTYPYYSCHDSLAKLAQQYPPAGKRLLVLVDGPPAATGKHARYPAAPSVLKYFKGANIDLLLDDYIRDDEKEIAALWQTEFSAANITHAAKERKLEKDACLISITV